MKRRQILKSTGGALAGLLAGGVAAVAANPTAASDREKVEAVEHYLACKRHAHETNGRACAIAAPPADRAFETAKAEGVEKGLEGDELAKYASEAYALAWNQAFHPYRAEVDAAWEANMEADVAAARLFGEERMA